MRASGRAAAGSRRAERGHLLVLLMIGVTVLLIMLTVAAQSWTFMMRREMELELVFRGEQYVKGIQAFRLANGGAFPIGNLDALVRKNTAGIRFMRKLYKNPMDPNGKWQYLYLHPGGTGFINPCATVPGALGAFLDASAPGRPVSGFGVGRGRPGSPMSNMNTRGQRRSAFRDEEGDAVAAGLSALDPKAFRETGISQMNLPIVGVVNCQQDESIRTYKGQTYLSNWAFTPLAQGEFAGNAQPAGMGAGAGFTGGLGLGGEARMSVHGRNNPGGTSREGRPTHAPPEEEDEDEADEDEGDEEDEEYLDVGEDDEGDEGEETQDPNQPSDPNHPVDPNQPSGPNHPSDPNHPPDPNGHAPPPGSS